MHQTAALLAADDTTLETPPQQVLRSLMAVQGWFRETIRQVAPQHSGPALGLLVQLDRCGPLRARELAEFSRVDPSVISRQVAHLADAGLVDREADPHDRRAQLLTLSAAGAAVLAETREAMLAVVEARLTDWDPDELRAFAEQLVRLITDLSG